MGPSGYDCRATGCGCFVHVDFNATSGSMRAAWRAGTYAALTTTGIRIRVTAKNVPKSHGLTWYKKAPSWGVNMADIKIPKPPPIPATTRPSRIASQSKWPALAPSAAGCSAREFVL